MHPERNPVVGLFRRFVPSVSDYRGARFSVIENGKRYATPLLLVVAVVEATDIVFAVDSIPAVFAVTRDPFIVYSSNIFAILGLRALYFVLADVIGRFAYLKFGLALVLVFVGAKMLLGDVFECRSRFARRGRAAADRRGACCRGSLPRGTQRAATSRALICAPARCPASLVGDRVRAARRPAPCRRLPRPVRLACRRAAVARPYARTAALRPDPSSRSSARR